MKLIEERILKTNKSTVESLNVLDTALNILINKTEVIGHRQFKVQIREKIKKNDFDRIIFDPLRKIDNGISYLEKLELIEIIPIETGIMGETLKTDVGITYKGIIKHSKGGFIGEYKQSKMKISSTYFFQILMPIVTIIAIVASVIIAFHS